jgi:hypothetical protein
MRVLAGWLRASLLSPAFLARAGPTAVAHRCYPLLCGLLEEWPFQARKPSRVIYLQQPRYAVLQKRHGIAQKLRWAFHEDQEVRDFDNRIRPSIDAAILQTLR